MPVYVITTDSGYLWLIENATDEADAVRQYYDGGAEQHQGVFLYSDFWTDDPADPDSHAEYLRREGQVS